MMDALLVLTRVLPAVPPVPVADVVTGTDHWWVGFILWSPLISLVLCGLCAACKVKSKLPAWITVLSLAISFVLTLLLANSETAPERILLFEWINVHWTGGSFISDFALYIDSLSILWMCFVTGLGTLIGCESSARWGGVGKRLHCRKVTCGFTSRGVPWMRTQARWRRRVWKMAGSEASAVRGSTSSTLPGGAASCELASSACSTLCCGMCAVAGRAPTTATQME